jgi:hypothetical protein
MIYYFSKSQWEKIWHMSYGNGYIHRKEKFMEIFPNLTYMEFATLNENKWGSISGEEIDINWFLLQFG